MFHICAGGGEPCTLLIFVSLSRVYEFDKEGQKKWI